MTSTTCLWQHKNKSYDFSCSGMTSMYEGDGVPCLPLRYSDNYKLIGVYNNDQEGIDKLNKALSQRMILAQYRAWLIHHVNAKQRRLK